MESPAVGLGTRVGDIALSAALVGSLRVPASVPGRTRSRCCADTRGPQGPALRSGASVSDRPRGRRWPQDAAERGSPGHRSTGAQHVAHTFVVMRCEPAPTLSRASVAHAVVPGAPYARMAAAGRSPAHVVAALFILRDTPPARARTVGRPCGGASCAPRASRAPPRRPCSRPGLGPVSFRQQRAARVRGAEGTGFPRRLRARGQPRQGFGKRVLCSHDGRSTWQCLSRIVSPSLSDTGQHRIVLPAMAA